MATTKPDGDLSAHQESVLDEIDDSEHPRDFPVDHDGDHWDRVDIVGSRTGRPWTKYVGRGHNESVTVLDADAVGQLDAT